MILEIEEKQLRGRGIAEAVVSDGLKAVEESRVVGGPGGVFAEESADGVEGAVKVTRNDEGFDGDDGVGLPGQWLQRVGRSRSR